MNPKELDVVLLTDGREVTILEVYDGGEHCYIEYQNPHTGDSDFSLIAKQQIKKLLWRAT